MKNTQFLKTAEKALDNLTEIMNEETDTCFTIFASEVNGKGEIKIRTRGNKVLLKKCLCYLYENNLEFREMIKSL